MKKQKICIIGGGLTGLVTAIALSRLNVDIDLVIGNTSKNIKNSNRTTAVSQSNYEFLDNLKITPFSKKLFWPCSHMKLYTKNENEKFKEIFAIDQNKKNKKIFYMMNNKILMGSIKKNIKKKKVINLKNNEKISKIINSGSLKSIKFKNRKIYKYNLIIVCTGSNSNLSKIFSYSQSFGHSYGEVSVTTVLKHQSNLNNIARQIFLDDEILALLPISNTRTSIVWSVKKKIIDNFKNQKEPLIKSRIKNYTKDFIKKIKFISNIEFKNTNLLIQKKYFNDRVLLFGDALHEVHPLAGQGFNMMLRDLINLEKILDNKINLGLDIGSLESLAEFSNNMKPRNFAYSIGIDFIKNTFSFKNQPFQNFRNKVILSLNKNNFIKDLFFNIANKGI